ncbi:MAG: U32 family peptidase [Bacteroidales bacterium]|nr:U32 family peptidase [Bacteroidales bacterium]
MSPVGSYESLMAAIQGGADAVYFGVGKLNMRSRSSQNFTLEDLKTISDICKNHKIKSYITLNTVVYDEEISEVRSVIDAAKECGIDAIIASDRAVINYAISQNVPVHASTQCNISNIEAVKYYAGFCDVIVLARELSLRQIEEVCQTINTEHIKGKSGKLLRIEVFAHGALCMSVSGKCYLSLDNLNHSANRGACLQQCRRAYKVTDLEDEHELLIDGPYIMSPKDLCTIGFLDKLINAGVSVLKIEGRGRSPEYVKTVTKCYKEASDAVLKGNYSKDSIDAWQIALSNVYNRGFWGGYYLGKKIGEWTDKYGSQATTKKEYIGKVNNYFSKLKVAEIKVESSHINVGDELLFIGPTTGVVENIVSEIRVNLSPVQIAEKGQTCSIPVSLVRRGDAVYKVITLK